MLLCILAGSRSNNLYLDDAMLVALHHLKSNAVAVQRLVQMGELTLNLE